MSVIDRSTSRDAALQEAFGTEVAALYEQTARGEANAALQRALELRSFLAVVEEQVARVRDRVHAATAADGDMSNLSADDLRLDADWLEAALAGRDGYATALDELLRAMPRSGQPFGTRAELRPKVTTTAPPVPTGPRAGAVRLPRP